MFDFYVISPIYNGVDGVTCWSVEQSHHLLEQADVRFKWLPGSTGKGDALIARSRSIACTAFLEYGEPDYMIFLDSDIVFQPRDLLQIFKDMKEGYELVGGIYPVRNGTQIASYFPHGKAPDGPPGVYECQFLSTGFMGINKSLLRKMVKELELPILHEHTPDMRSYPFFEDRAFWNDHADNAGNQWIWLSEDWDFCEKAKKVGVKPHLDTRVILGHQGNYVWTLKDIESHQAGLAIAKEQEELKEKYKIGEGVDWVAMGAEDA